MEGKRTQATVKVENTVENNIALAELLNGDGGVILAGPVDAPSAQNDHPNQSTFDDLKDAVDDDEEEEPEDDDNDEEYDDEPITDEDSD